MITKVCIKCGEEKEISFFSERKDSKDGYRNICKECRNIDNLKYRIENIDKKKEYLIIWRHINRDKINESKRKWIKNNPEQHRKNNKKYYIENKDKVLKRTNKNKNDRMKIDLLFKLRQQMRSNINKSMKRNSLTKKLSTVDILGCSFNDFKLYLEQRFEPWMNWENYGKYNGELNYGWDIDHVIPQSTGYTEDNIYKLNHYTNLQPLCSKTNRDIKKNKEVY